MSLNIHRYIVLCFLPLLTACKPIPQTVNNNFYYPSAHVGEIRPVQTLSAWDTMNCRIVCFSRDAKGALYPIDKSANPIYVKGFVEIPGQRDAQRICRPQSYGTTDISVLQELKDVCKVFVKSCDDGCWAGGNA